MLVSNCGENDASRLSKILVTQYSVVPVPRREDNEEAKEEEETIHFTGSDENVQLLLKMVISVNQRSFYEAVVDFTKELPDDHRVPGKPVASDQMEQDILMILSLQKYHPTTSDRETYCKLRAKI